MPIGDLLAQISGDNTAVPVKRKSNDADLRRNESKSARRVTPTQASRPGMDKDAPRPYAGSARPGVISSVRPVRPVQPSKPPPVPPAAAPTKAPPKKGSFAEILARGQKAQASMGQIGRIQHKTVEKGAIKRSREEAAATDPRRGKKPNANAAGYSGTSKPDQQRNGANGHHKPLSHRDATRPSTAEAPRRKVQAKEVPPKKEKKAAAATTGYTGTSRPKVEALSRSKKIAAPRGGALLNGPAHGSARRSGYQDDYDEELDDFIEYDDEEVDGGGGRTKYDYASDGSSDMEAGMDELDMEERRATFIARKEDEEEERMERSLKSAKEERKREALEAYRAKRNR